MTLIRQSKPREQKRQYFNLDLGRLGLISDFSTFYPAKLLTSLFLQIDRIPD